MARKTDHKQYPQKLSRLNFFSRLEVAELPKLLLPEEQVLGVISGFYAAGTAILCVTSRRLLLVDKKLLRMSFEDIRFESIKEVSFSHQMMLASVKFFYAGRTLQFRSWYGRELRILAQFVQHKMFEVRKKQEHPAHEALQYQTDLAEPIGAVDYSLEEPMPLPEATPSVAISSSSTQVNPQLEQYLSERIARWRKASKFIDTVQATPKA